MIGVAHISTELLQLTIYCMCVSSTTVMIFTVVHLSSFIPSRLIICIIMLKFTIYNGLKITSLKTEFHLKFAEEKFLAIEMPNCQYFFHVNSNFRYYCKCNNCTSRCIQGIYPKLNTNNQSSRTVACTAIQ